MKGVQKIPTGIDGLDRMLSGGVPVGHVVSLMGVIGTGKTIFSIQFILEGLKRGENCIYITLEEEVESILKSAFTFGFDLKRYMDNKQLHLIKLDPADVKATIKRVESELSGFITSVGAKRIVIDSVSVLAMLFPTAAERRRRIFELSHIIKETGATALLITEAKSNFQFQSREGYVEYIADGVINLQFMETDVSGKVGLAIRVVKMRHIPHDRHFRPFEISEKGIQVHSESSIYEFHRDPRF